jgi:hypothetical protein
MLVADPEIKILVSPEFKKHPNVERLWELFGMKVRHAEHSAHVHAVLKR